MKTEWRQFLVNSGAEFHNGSPAHFGAPDRERQLALTGDVFADLSHLGVIGVHGADAESFLQGQLTADLRGVDAAHAAPGGYCDAKGRLIACMRILRRADLWALELPQRQLEAVLEHLHRFVLRARVSLEDVSDGLVRIGAAGADVARELEDAVGVVPDAPWTAVKRHHLTLVRLPGPWPRFEIFGELVEPMQRLWDRLNVRCVPVGTDSWQLLEIVSGLPAIYPETMGRFLPQMVNLDLIGGVSFRKGCYPGQEVIARLRYRGTLKRRMYLAHLEGGVAPAPGDALYAGSRQAVGEVVDARPHPDGGYALLAVIERHAVHAAEALHLDAGHGRLRIDTLPYPLDADTAGRQPAPQG